MLEALTLEALQNSLTRRYEYGEERVVGIMLARYNLKMSKDIVEQNYLYWHKLTGRKLDVYWAGYGAHLQTQNQTPTKTILQFEGNSDHVYFDLDAFVEFTDELEECYTPPYNDRIQLLLVNYREGKLRFDESLMIDLEKNKDPDYANIREIVAFLTYECRYAHRVEPIARQLKLNHLKDVIKGVTLSDVLSTAIGIAELV